MRNDSNKSIKLNGPLYLKGVSSDEPGWFLHQIYRRISTEATLLWILGWSHSMLLAQLSEVPDAEERRGLSGPVQGKERAAHGEAAGCAHHHHRFKRTQPIAQIPVSRRPSSRKHSGTNPKLNFKISFKSDYDFG